eukprot:PITA_18596
MAKTQSARFEIEKFNGKNNFEIWKVKMHDLLVQHGVAKALLGKAKHPYNITDSKWAEMDERAISAIRLCLADDVLFNIVLETTAVGLWMKLEKLYMTKSLTNRILPKRQLYGLRMKEGTLIADHLNAFNTLLVQLQSIEVKIPSEDKAITLLCSLPEPWDHFVTSISLSSSETIEFDDVVASLLSEETRRKSHSETSTSEAMMVRGCSKERRPRKPSDSRSKSKGKKSKLKCWFCGKSRHLKKDCWKRQQQTSKEESSTEKKEVNTTDTGSTSGSGMSDEVLSVNVSNHGQHWLLYSEASDHMCIHKKWFKEYKSINDGVVYMGNDVTCNIVGIGSIQLQMFDGTTRILTDVRHVPDLRKNLISLGALDSNGYKTVIQGGVMKIYKGILLVMKAKKVGNLFQLDGGTGSAFVSTVSAHDSSSIHLWHQRLGHMSERGLKLLADRKLLPNLKSGKLDFFFKQFRALVENNTSRTIKCLRTDNGGEFTSKEFDSYCKDARIERHKTTVYTPQQNGVAEHMNRTLLERARTIDCNIPQEVWKGHPCDYSKLRVFGCDAYALVPKHQRTKLDPKSKRYIFVGYGVGTKGYRLWDPTTRKIIINRDVKFNESSLVQLDVDSRLKQDDVSDFQHIPFDSTSNDSHDDHSSDTNHEQVSESDHEQGSGIDHEQVSDTDHQEVPTDGSQPIEEAPETSLRRSTRIKRPPKRYDDYVTSVAFTANDNEPLCYQEAVEGSKSDKWKVAMKDEMMALGKNGTCDLVELPKDRKTVGCKWVFKLKRGVNDMEDRYKARLVAKGFSQKAGIDFHEIFSPVVKIVSIRIVLALVALFDLELQQLDVKTAFLHGDLDEEIYMEQPEGFVQHRNAKFVCRLKKSLYGLKQSPRQWYKKFDSFMLSQKYVRSEYDHFVYFKQLNNGIFIILVLYVDDML